MVEVSSLLATGGRAADEAITTGDGAAARRRRTTRWAHRPGMGPRRHPLPRRRPDDVRSLPRSAVELDARQSQLASRLRVRSGSAKRDGDEVLRLDPTTGDVQGPGSMSASGPLKLQPADGACGYVPTRPTCASTRQPTPSPPPCPRLRSGPAPTAAGPSTAQSGSAAGDALHRYDPATVKPVAVVALTLDCGQVYATDDQSPWRGPTTRRPVRAAARPPRSSTPRSNPVGPPSTSPSTSVSRSSSPTAVFFPAFGGRTAVVLDTPTGTVVATPDLAVATRGSQSVLGDGAMWIPAQDANPALVFASTQPPTPSPTGSR